MGTVDWPATAARVREALQGDADFVILTELSGKEAWPLVLALDQCERGAIGFVDTEMSRAFLSADESAVIGGDWRPRTPMLTCSRSCVEAVFVAHPRFHTIVIAPTESPELAWAAMLARMVRVLRAQAPDGRKVGFVALMSNWTNNWFNLHGVYTSNSFAVQEVGPVLIT